MVCLDANVEEVPRRPRGNPLVSLVPAGAIDAPEFERIAHERIPLEG